MTLRQRLLIRLTLVLGMSLLIASAFAYGRAGEQVREELHAALVVGQQVLVDAVKEIDKAPSPYQKLRIILERFSGGRHLQVTLLDTEGKRIASSHLAQPSDPAPEWFYAAMKEESESGRVALPASVKGYSSFLIETDSRNEVHEFWDDILYGVSVLACLGAAVFALIYWTLGNELAPLGKLNEAFALVADGDFTRRVARPASSDLGAVCEGFNEMASRLEQTESANVKLHEQLSNVQEEERAELARNLHDDIGPLLFSVGLDAAAVQKAAGGMENIEIATRLASIREAVSLSQKHVLQVLGRLRSGTVEDLGLESAIRQQIEFWRARHPKIEISADLPEDGVSLELDPVVFRVVQESLSNAVRHGQPRRIDILVANAPDGMTRVMISDDGGGLRSERQGHGLTGMSERVTARGGSLTIRNRIDQQGTMVLADFPPLQSMNSLEEGAAGANIL